ncbi:MAG: zinc ribbon domain-containing protein [Promethearchaeota archaeon]
MSEKEAYEKKISEIMEGVKKELDRVDSMTMKELEEFNQKLITTQNIVKNLAKLRKAVSPSKTKSVLSSIKRSSIKVKDNIKARKDAYVLNRKLNKELEPENSKNDKFCPNCGKKLDLDSKICSKCGTEIIY